MSGNMDAEPTRQADERWESAGGASTQQTNPAAGTITSTAVYFCGVGREQSRPCCDISVCMFRVGITATISTDKTDLLTCEVCATFVPPRLVQCSFCQRMACGSCAVQNPLCDRCGRYNTMTEIHLYSKLLTVGVYECGNCRSSVPLTQVSRHLEVCPASLIPCFVCLLQVRRDSIAKHILDAGCVPAKHYVSKSVTVDNVHFTHHMCFIIDPTKNDIRPHGFVIVWLSPDYAVYNGDVSKFTYDGMDCETTLEITPDTRLPLSVSEAASRVFFHLQYTMRTPRLGDWSTTADVAKTIKMLKCCILPSHTPFFLAFRCIISREVTDGEDCDTSPCSSPAGFVCDAVVS